jgi:solute carrier family 10 (sodium/bile acid cotransporter), member 7
LERQRNVALKNALGKYWFFIGIVVMLFVAIYLPSVGIFVKKNKILSFGIFVSFLLTGLTIETSHIIEELRNLKVHIAALFSSLIFFPVISYYLANIFFSAYPDFVIGTLIIGVAPVTVASGTVMTAIALGNVPLSLFICVLGNFFSILTIPFMVNLILRLAEVSITLPVLKMLIELSITVLLPVLIGQALRMKLKEKTTSAKCGISIFNQCIVLLIILNALSSSIDGIIHAGSALFLVFLFMICLHFMIILLNMNGARLLRMDPPSTAAFTIHTSQKTLTVSYLVWAGYFAAKFPSAFIPAIAYHLTQMVMDTFVAHWFRRKNADQKITD